MHARMFARRLMSGGVAALTLVGGCTPAGSVTGPPASATAAEQEPDAGARTEGATCSPSCTTDELLWGMKSMYAGLGSYADTGEVVTIFVSADGRRHGSRKPFRTAFVRPDRFRFEFTEQENEFATQDPFVVWSDGDTTRVWWTLRPSVRTMSSVRDGIWAAAGVSGGSSSMVPTMLLGLRDFPLDLVFLSRARVDGEEKVERTRCVRLTWSEAEQGSAGITMEPPPPGMDVPDSTTETLTAWISVQDLTLRKLVETTRFSDFRSEDTITWRPTPNAEIEPSEFAFVPPSTGQPGDAD